MLSVPFFPDDGELCGPVSLAAVLHYWDRPVPLSSITEAIYSEQAGGTLPHDLLWFARQQGLQGERRTGNLEQIRKSIDQGVPLILLVGTGNSRFPANHLLVVTGYDSDAVYVHSATFRNLRLPNHNLQALWKPHDNWMLLIAPSDQSLPPA